MQILSQLTELGSYEPAVLTIGFFDGVHRGHQQVIRRVTEYAFHQGSQAVLVTFWPHPQRVLHPEQPKPLLTTLQEKLEVLAALGGLDTVVVMPFTAELAQLTPQKYLEVLCTHFQLRVLIVGADFAQYRLDKENDALDALDGQRPAVAGRLVEQHDDLSEGTLQFGHLAVLRTGAGKFRAWSKASAWIAAQATRGQQRRPQISHQALEQGFLLHPGCLLEGGPRIGDHRDGMGETEPIRVQPQRLGRLQHQHPYRIIGQEQTIELLLDALRGLRAQGGLAEPLMGIDFVNGSLDLESRS